MKTEFYTGQPLILKNTGEKVAFLYDDGDCEAPCYVLKERRGKQFYHDYYDYDELEPSTEFKFSELMAGLEQGYFEVGTEFRTRRNDKTIKVKQGVGGLYLERTSEPLLLTSIELNSTWILVGN